MYQRFVEHIKSEFSELLSKKSILACSGGIDSVVLAHLCAKAGLTFAIAHCNFQLRGKESDADEEFVVELADKLNIEYFVNHFNTKEYALKNKLSIQEAARELRYGWFEDLALQQKAEYILIAHHADDNLETFFINLSRGTGIRGLTGIPSRSGRIRRPLLNFSRSDILDYAYKEGLDWREDSSNQEEYYLRNKIRHSLTPILLQLNPSFLSNFNKSQAFLVESDQILQKHIASVRSELFIKDNRGWRIRIDALKELEPLNGYLHALFSGYGFTDWRAIALLLDALSGKEVISATHRLIRDRGALLLVPLVEQMESNYEFSLSEGFTNGPIRLIIEPVDAIGKVSAGILYVDKETLNHRLCVRKWEKGDYFYPLGMKGKKLVSKYFKDEKMNTLEKEDQWLLFSGGELVWIIGKRADNRFKVTPKTKNILRISLET